MDRQPFRRARRAVLAASCTGLAAVALAVPGPTAAVPTFASVSAPVTAAAPA